MIVRCPWRFTPRAIRSRFSHELEHQDFGHVGSTCARHIVHEAMATAGKTALAPTKKLSVYVKQFVDRLRELAEDDLPVMKLIDLSLQDITERRHICHMTGMTPSAYHNAFRRLQRLADKIPMNLRTAALDSLR